MFNWSTFKNFLKFSLFVIFATLVVYLAIDLIQEKNNLMDIEEYKYSPAHIVNICKISKTLREFFVNLEKYDDSNECN